MVSVVLQHPDHRKEGLERVRCKRWPKVKWEGGRSLSHTKKAFSAVLSHTF